MRQTFELWIDGQKADMDAGSYVVLNYSQDELSNPAVIRNSYSQSITLPATATNNRIFNNCLRPDHKTGSGFDAYARTPFRLMNERREVVEEGYLKLDKGQHGKNYVVTLFGGIGSFFYRLSAKADGSAMNLGDLTYTSGGHSFTPNYYATTMAFSARSVADCWRELCDDEMESPWDIYWSFFLNFAPAYNKKPDNFDRKKVIVGDGQFRNIATSGSETPYSGNSLLVTCENEHTEAEMRDFRAYLQRPIVNVLAVLDAVSAYDATFSITATVRKRMGGLWMTMPMPERTQATRINMSKLFEGTPTPAEFLISIAKAFGFVFDIAPGKVQMMTRSEYYAGGTTVDINGRIMRDQTMEVKPYGVDARYFVLSVPMTGEYAEDYAKRYGKAYGEQVINTNYPFSDERKELLEKCVLNGAPMNVESSQNMFIQYNAATSAIWNFVPSMFETVKYKVSDGGEWKDKEAVPFYSAATLAKDYYNPAHEYYDYSEKPDLSGDGTNVLLYLTGRILIGTEITSLTGVEWHVSDDYTNMLEDLNEGVPCWDVRTGVHEKLNSLPTFGRYNISPIPFKEYSLDFGVPQEGAVPWLNPADFPDTLYSEGWQALLADRYDKGAKVITCKVYVSGLRFGRRSLRDFYFFDNSLWSLNKIKNYDIADGDVAECEFVKVIDKNNYL